MSTAATDKEQGAPARLLTIGAVCRRLKSEFPDISISKIRYLEDQKLLTPKRTQGGYRLFGEEDVEVLRRILQLQRDEFLPLRVIRQELASATARDRLRRRTAGLDAPEEELDLADLVERSGVSAQFARELEEFGLLAPKARSGEKRYTESDVDVAVTCGRLSEFGIAPRNLRPFRTAADRNAALLETVVAPALRSRNPERRQSAVDDLQTLAELSQELAQLLFRRALREQAGFK